MAILNEHSYLLDGMQDEAREKGLFPRTSSEQDQ
jgi:hypothetical protein